MTSTLPFASSTRYFSLVFVAVCVVVFHRVFVQRKSNSADERNWLSTKALALCHHIGIAFDQTIRYTGAFSKKEPLQTRVLKAAFTFPAACDVPGTVALAMERQAQIIAAPDLQPLLVNIDAQDLTGAPWPPEKVLQGLRQTTIDFAPQRLFLQVRLVIFRFRLGCVCGCGPTSPSLTFSCSVTATRTRKSAWTTK